MEVGTETSKPRRIKALLSSFLKGVSRTDKDKRDDSETEPVGDIPGGVTETEVKDDFVVIENLVPQSDEQSSTALPQNRQAFFKRVETFSTSTWFAKPEAVSPLRCAQFGWENIGVDSLKCVTCKEVLYGGLPPKWEADSYKNACKKLEDSLQNGHSKICPWPSNPSPASFLEVQLLNHSEAERAFLHRVSSIRCFGTKMPAVDRSFLPQSSTEEGSDSVSRLVTGVLGEQPTSDYKDRIELVCILALCGWSRSSSEDSDSPTMMCEYCRRTIGLWNFAPCGEGGSERDATIDTPEPAPKRFKVSKGPLNPIEEHRSWCPWTKPTTSTFRVSSLPKQTDQAEEVTLRPAWQELLVLLQRRSSPGKVASDGPLTNKAMTPPSQAWKVVRRIANFWQSHGTSRKT
ncbi:zinc finger C3HC-type protein 1-like [Diadema antillarum]|uniref:zinc finger C3HC-type protein 1-like n=1 Tax=Diadema antillarum TaxID=105358 RepID=UPI003A882C3C